MLKQSVLIGVCGFLLAGCGQPPFEYKTSSTPLRAHYPVSWQQKWRVVHHWSVHAEQEAIQLAALPSVAGSPVYITDATGGSAFGKAFKNMLTTQLVDRNLVVVDGPARGATEIVFTAQWVDNATKGDHDVLITTKAIRGGQVIASDYGVYYMDPGDVRNFAGRKPPTPSRKVSVVKR